MSDQENIVVAPTELDGVDQQKNFYPEGTIYIHPTAKTVYKRINGNWVLQEQPQ